MVGPDTRPLPAHELAGLRIRLQEHWAFRQNQLLDLASRSARPGDRCTIGRIEVHFRLSAAATKVLGDIETALMRMDTGQYGTCRRCGTAISLQRLRIVPHAPCCARCHRAEEVGA
ncbi:hypothetical protein GCM10009743_36870 [Kribbella swartbergensis]